MAQIEVKSHVSRDLLQAAAMFKNERLVVWEYVSNGLDYVDPGTSPVVHVRLDSKRHTITIQDNGRGMAAEGLQNFFLMHGENIDRKAGRAGRGRFGTGKSAALGIGDILRITTVSNGQRSKVELTRADLDGMTSGDPVPVRIIERQVSTDQPNGTLVEIAGIHLRALDQPGVIKYIERHLAHWPKDVTVLVNHHECEFAEPPVERTETYLPSADQQALLGAATLIIKVSRSPLEEDLRGVSIFADGVWHETTLLSSAGKDMAEFMFGEIDVPKLDEDTSTPPPFDASRSLKLNASNELVRAIYAFVAPRLEEVRKRLIEAQSHARATEEAKRLQREASQIESIINDDFRSFRKRVQKVRAVSTGTGFDTSDGIQGETEGPDEDDDFLFGGEQPASVVQESGEPGINKPTDDPRPDVPPYEGPPRRLNPIVTPDPGGETTGHTAKRDDEGKPKPRGGFRIEFDHQGEDSGRALYQREKRTIYINLDHPQIAAAKKNHGVEDPAFRRLAYEVAFSEYAIALASELDSRGEFMDASDAIFEIRDTIHRIARAGAGMYA